MSSRKELANAIRALSMDAVQKANSGHPGAPMGMADIAEVLWRGYLNHNPTNPHWADHMGLMLLMRMVEKKVAVPGLISVGGK